MIEDKDWQFQCCGVVSQLNYNQDGSDPLVLQIWRQKDASAYELISSQTVTAGILQGTHFCNVICGSLSSLRPHSKF